MTTNETPHIPVLLNEVLDALRPGPGMTFIDGTLGAGGHTAALLSAHPSIRVLAFDRDPAAIETARVRLGSLAERATLIHGSYAGMVQQAPAHGFEAVDGILLDLGFSSMQIDDSARGFAFRFDGPLDMRYDPTVPLTAAQIVNRWPEEEIANLIYHYGEDRHSRRIARGIIAARPIETTTQLAEVVAKSTPRSKEKIHPATRTFQALRIVVNGELDELEAVLPGAVELLRPGGRLAVISFHSLEDRIVKHFMKDAARDWLPDPVHPMGGVDVEPTLRVLTKKPIEAGPGEAESNPRARSAKLRVAERTL